MNLKSLVSAAFATGAILCSGATSALPLYKEFTVEPPGPKPSFIADKMVGNYREVITLGAGTFDFSIAWSLGQFATGDGGTTINPIAYGFELYNVYATFTGSGTFSTVAGTTTFSLTPGGALNLYMDNHAGVLGAVTSFDVPGQTATAVPVLAAGSADDTLLASGLGIVGTGTLTCTVGNCGSFGQLTSLGLTPAGSAYFTAPVPFHSLAFESGQFNAFAPTPGTTQILNGSMDVFFPNQVSEPGPLALSGIALLGLGWVGRRRRSANLKSV